MNEITAGGIRNSFMNSANTTITTPFSIVSSTAKSNDTNMKPITALNATRDGSASRVNAKSKANTSKSGGSGRSIYNTRNTMNKRSSGTIHNPNAVPMITPTTTSTNSLPPEIISKTNTSSIIDSLPSLNTSLVVYL